MASHQVCETLAFINDDDGVKGMEINGALLMSLMEESPSDERNDERLDTLMKSFEAEISGSKMMGGHDSSGSKLMSHDEDGESSCNTSYVEGQDSWASISSSDEYGVEWVDMDLIPSSPFNDEGWYTDPCGHEYDGFEMAEQGYNSLWEDNYELCG